MPIPPKLFTACLYEVSRKWGKQSALDLHCQLWLGRTAWGLDNLPPLLPITNKLLQGHPAGNLWITNITEKYWQPWSHKRLYKEPYHRESCWWIWKTVRGICWEQSVSPDGRSKSKHSTRLRVFNSEPWRWPEFCLSWEKRAVTEKAL